MNAWDAVREAVRAGRAAQAAVNDNAGVMAELLAGNLRRGSISHRVLAKLKRELAAYNIHTGRWRD